MQIDSTTSPEAQNDQEEATEATSSSESNATLNESAQDTAKETASESSKEQSQEPAHEQSQEASQEQSQDATLKESTQDASQSPAQEPAAEPAQELTNYFELFGLPLKFLLDKEKLEDTYLKLQANFHPDKYAAADVLQKSIAAKQSSLINIAYKELLNPTKRAAHLLRIVAGAKAEDFTGENTIDDTDFLMEQMKWREAIDDGEGDEQAMQKLLQEIQQTQQEIHQSFADACEQQVKPSDSNDPSNKDPQITPEGVAQLGGLITKMRYFSKLEQDLESRS